MKNFNSFTNCYPVCKSLQFRLIPVGKTEEHMIQNKVLQDDEVRASLFQDVKKLIDGYHRAFINEVLEPQSYDWTELADCLDNPVNDKKKMIDVKNTYLNSIHMAFANDDRFKNLDKAAMFNLYLPEYYKDDAEALLKIKYFKGFTSYFANFNKNRMNIYSADDKASSIGHRIVSENFTFFNSNLHVYHEIKNILQDDLKKLEENISKDITPIKLDEIFTVNGFNDVLTQHGIELYNTILDGYSKEDRSKVKGVNEIVNLSIQQHKLSKYSTNKLMMKKLYNQILRDHQSNPFNYETFEKDEDVINALKAVYDEYHQTYKTKINNVLYTLPIDDNVLIPMQEIRTISYRMFKNYAGIENELHEQYRQTFGKCGKLTQKQENDFKKKKVWTIHNVKNAIKVLNIKNNTQHSLENYFTEFLDDVDITEHELQLALSDYNPIYKLSQQDNAITAIKTVYEQLIDLLKTLNQYDHVSEAASSTYIDQINVEHFRNDVLDAYNKTRNYVTRASFNTQQIKLNFNNPNLGAGWSITKETDYMSNILRRHGKYYLGILSGNKKPIIPEPNSKNGYEKMVYHYISDVSKMLPKCIFTKAVKNHFEGADKNNPFVLYNPKTMAHGLTISLYDYQIYKRKMMNDSYDGPVEEHREALRTWIKLCMALFHVYKSWKEFDLSAIKKPEEYQTLKEFYQDLNNACYQVSFVPVSYDQIKQMIDDDQLYLFQIYDKDYSSAAHGNQNLYTMYLESLFSDYNFKHHIYQLNGGAQLFFRKASLPVKATHKAGSFLVNKVTTDGETIPDEIYTNIYNHFNHNTTLSVEAKTYLKRVTIKKTLYDIYKDHRYQEDQYFIHFPITINYQQSSDIEINDAINNYLRHNDEIKILGIDRGERNLVYVCLTDKNGHILEQRSLNTVEIVRADGSKQRVDYLAKLKKLERERDCARKNWTTIKQIKNLKEGYLSTIVPQIAQMAIENNAIIVLEDLNHGFKQDRVKIDHQLYQNFEIKLIKKLNLFISKTYTANAEESIYHGYQLTAPFKSYDKVDKQTGIIFYVNPAYTSKIDPVTGFADVFKHGIVKNKYVEFIDTFDSIYYDNEKDMFAFSFDYSKLSNMTSIVPPKTEWTVYTNGTRIVYNRNATGIPYTTITLTETIKDILNNYHIVYDNGNDILNSINLLDQKEQKSIKKKLTDCFLTTIQMRNSNAITGEDYIISPVLNKNNEFFQSCIYDSSMPIDGDANGAYNIARKGIMLLSRINSEEKPNLYINNTDWFSYIGQ